MCTYAHIRKCTYTHKYIIRTYVFQLLHMYLGGWFPCIAVYFSLVIYSNPYTARLIV